MEIETHLKTLTEMLIGRRDPAQQHTNVTETMELGEAICGALRRCHLDATFSVSIPASGLQTATLHLRAGLSATSIIPSDDHNTPEPPCARIHLTISEYHTNQWGRQNWTLTEPDSAAQRARISCALSGSPDPRTVPLLQHSRNHVTTHSGLRRNQHEPHGDATQCVLTRIHEMLRSRS